MRESKDCDFKRPLHSLFLDLHVKVVDTAESADYLGLQGAVVMFKTRAKYALGQVVRHRKHPFRGVVFDVDAMFSNTDEWYEAIPEDSRPKKDQPFYHLLAENDQSYYVAYVSEQNLVADYSGEPVEHPDLPEFFGDFDDGQYPLHVQMN